MTNGICGLQESRRELHDLYLDTPRFEVESLEILDLNQADITSLWHVSHEKKTY